MFNRKKNFISFNLIILYLLIPKNSSTDQITSDNEILKGKFVFNFIEISMVYSV